MLSSRHRETAELWRKISGLMALTGLLLFGAIGYVGTTRKLSVEMIVPVVGAVACAALLVCGLVAFAYLADRRRGA